MTGTSIIGGIGALASAGSAIYQAKEQKKAARSAAAAAASAADHAVATSTTSAAAEQVTSSAEGAREAVQKAKQRRMSVSSTMSSAPVNGLRMTLG